MSQSHLRVRLEEIIGTLSFLLGVLTIIVPSWIEDTLGVDPDGGSGSLEWLIVAGLLVIALACGSRARRRHRVVAAQGPE